MNSLIPIEPEHWCLWQRRSSRDRLHPGLERRSHGRIPRPDTAPDVQGRTYRSKNLWGETPRRLIEKGAQINLPNSKIRVARPGQMTYIQDQSSVRTKKGKRI